MINTRQSKEIESTRSNKMSDLIKIKRGNSHKTEIAEKTFHNLVKPMSVKGIYDDRNLSQDIKHIISNYFVEPQSIKLVNRLDYEA